jgi:hypothetical protein
MTPTQFRQAIKSLNLSYREVGELFRFDKRTSRRYAAGDAVIPESTAKLLRLVINGKLTLEDVKDA